MTKFVNSHRTKAAIVLFISLVLASYRSIILRNNIDIDTEKSFTRYFITKNALTVSFVFIAIFFAAIFVLFALLARYKRFSLPDPISSPVIFTSALSGFMLISTGMYFIYVYFAKNGVFEIRELILAILMVFASAPFLYSSLVKTRKNNDTYAYLQLIPIVFSGYRLISDFMRQNHLPVNSSGAIQILGMIFLMLFFIRSGKISSPAKKGLRVYLIYAYLAAFMLLLYAVPSLTLSGFHTMLPLNEYVLMSAVDIVLALHIIYSAYNVASDEEPE